MVGDKQLSKAEVLERAKRRIKMLEMETETLEK